MEDGYYKIKNKEIREYFYSRYKNATIQVVPGHWPNFKSKEQVDRWFKLMDKIAQSMKDLFEDNEEA